MSQIAVRLSDDQLDFLDAAVREGRFASRADAVRQSVRAMERALVDERDAARIRAVDGPLYPDLEGLHDWAADQPLGLD